MQTLAYIACLQPRDCEPSTFLGKDASQKFRQVLQAMAQQPARGPKRRRLEAEHTDVLIGVKDDTFDEDVLVRRLTDYVERVDTDMVRPALR